MRTGVLALMISAACSASALCQAPTAVQSLSEPAQLPPALRDSIIAKARPYPFLGYRLFGSDSALLVFEDSTLTTAATRASAWMFGPPVTAAEADSCPPEKVLGRRIARVFWRGLGRPAELQTLVVAVRGTKGIDRWTVITMYYYKPQLVGQWAGDPSSR